MSEDLNYFEEEDFTTEFNGQTVRRILGLTTHHKRWLFGFVAAVAAVAGMDSYFTYLSKRIIDEGIVAGNQDALREIVIVYGGLIVLQAVMVFAFIYLAGILGERIRYDLRKRLFNHLQTLSFGYYDRTPVGWMMSRATSDTDRVAELVTWGLLDITWGIMNIGTAMFFMIYINWQLGLIVSLIIPVLVFVAIQFKKKIIVEYRQVRKINSKITGSYNETITGVRVVKSLVRERENLEEFAGLTSEMYKASYRAAWLSALFLPTVQILSAVAIGSIVWYGGWQVNLGGLTAGGIQAFISYVTFMLWPIQEMARVYAEMQQAIASAERIFSLLDQEPELMDRPDAVAAADMWGDIEFQDVTFYYEEDKPVLGGLNLHVERGETIALVGPTGGGKSTIVNLICRFYEPKAGTIHIAGRDYTEWTLDSIQSRVGMVLQTPHLFSGSIRENIRYGRLNATDAEVEEAAQLAHAHEFIEELENGYEQEVGEGGGLLSMGQKQLISLARAILAQPNIFIMDEATSSVDTLTEGLIQKGIATITAQCTSFIIAHRLSTIKSADRILVIENGGISEMGSHAELIRAKGHYYRLYTQQFRHDLEQKYNPLKMMAEAQSEPVMG